MKRRIRQGKRGREEKKEEKGEDEEEEKGEGRAKRRSKRRKRRKVSDEEKEDVQNIDKEFVVLNLAFSKAGRDFETVHKTKLYFGGKFFESRKRAYHFAKYKSNKHIVYLSRFVDH